MWKLSRYAVADEKVVCRVPAIQLTILLCILSGHLQVSGLTPPTNLSMHKQNAFTQAGYTHASSGLSQAPLTPGHHSMYDQTALKAAGQLSDTPPTPT